MSLYDLDFPPESFDTVLLLGQNLGLGDAEGIRSYLSKLYEVTSPDGIIIGEARDPYATDMPRARMAQIVMQLERHQTSKEAWRNHLEFSNLKWKDYDDFENKYGSDNNSDNYIVRQITSGNYQRMGILVKYGMLDKNLAFDINGQGVIQHWNLYKEIIMIQRELYDQPMLAIHWEYLYNEMLKIAKERGLDIDVKYHHSYTEEVKKKIQP